MLINLIAGLVAVSCSLLCLAAETTGDFPRSHRDGEITIELLERKLERAKGKSDLDRGTRLERISLYERAIDNFEAYQLFQQRYERLDSNVEASAEVSERLAEKMQALALAAAAPEPGVEATRANGELLARTLRRTNAREMVAHQNVARLRKELASQRQRLVEARRELTATVNRMNQQRTTERSKNVRDVVSPLLLEARRIELRTAQLAAHSRSRLLTLELASHNPRLKLLKQRIAIEQLEIQQLQHQGRALESALSERRAAEAREMASETRALEQRYANQHKLLRGASSDNAAIGERLLPLAKALDTSTARSRQLQQQINVLQKNYSVTLQKIESAVTSTAAMSRVIERQRRALPDADDIRDELAAKQQLAADLILEMFALEEQIEALGDLQAFARRLTDQSDIQSKQGTFNEDAGELDTLAGLLRQRHALYRLMLSWNEFYRIQVEQNIHFLGLLGNTVSDFDNYLKERHLWTRSLVEPRDTEALYSKQHQIVPDWATEGAQLRAIFTPPTAWTALFYGCCGIAIGILILRGALLRSLASTTRWVGNVEYDRFRYTIKALLITLLLTIPGPLVAVSMAAQFINLPEQTRLTLGLEQGLWNLAENWFFLLFFYLMCRPDGLAQRHFAWDEAMLQSVRSVTLWLIILFIPVGWLNQTLVSYYAVEGDNTVKRIILALSMLVFSGTFIYVLRKGGVVMQTLQRKGHSVALVRLRLIRLLVFIVLPAVLIAFTMFGYAHTAVIIGSQVKESLWVVLVAIIFYELSKRWLSLSEARHEEESTYDNATHNVFSPGDSSLTSYRVRLAAFGTLGDASLRLVNALTIILAAAGLLFVWSDALPALGYLDNIEIWRYNSIGENSIVANTVSLADLFQSLLALILVLFLYRNLPPILDLILQQLFVLAPGNRSTIIALTSYGIVIVGVGFALVKLGFEWSRFQWLVAALGVGIGFGLREIVANFISGVIIILERPIRVGDLVTIGQIEGTVSRIRIRATNITTPDHQELVVPNKDFITGSLLNWSLSDRMARLSITVGIAYGADVEHAIALIAEVARADYRVLGNPSPLVTCEKFGDDSIELRLRYYMDDMDARLETRSRLILCINQALVDAGIEFGFAQRDVHFDAEQPLKVELQQQR